jgi:serine/threonine protein phosphatase PrpC
LHRADTVIDGWETDSIRVRAATVRGYSHRYDGSPRQDDFALAILPECGWLVAAVADGVSSARQSHIGSSEALRFVTSWLAASKPGSLTEINWKALVDGAAWHLVETARKLLQDPGADAKAAEKEVATTLICAVVAPGAEGFEASVIGIGDSGVWLLGSEGFSKVKGGKAEASGGISSSAVNGLPQVPTEIVSVSVAVKSGQALLLGTDGFGDPLGDGDGLVGGLFKRGLIDSVPSLIEFAHMLDFSRETFDDDRTLVAIWPKIPASTKEGQPAQPTALAPIPDSSLAVAHQRPEHKTEVGRR